MIIRKEQFEVFKDTARAIAENRLVEHSRQFAPGLFHAAGEDGIRQAVRLGMHRAQGYSFRDEPQIRFYIDMMLVLGSDFDTDPQFPWAGETLRDHFSRSHVRGIVLYRDLSLYLDRVMGPSKEHLKRALERFLHLPSELPPPEQRQASNLRNWLDALFPQKSEDVTDTQLHEIAVAAAQLAYQVRVPGGDGLFGGAMLVFGHGVAHDSLYPWISSVLGDPRVVTPEARLKRLWAKLRVYANSAVQYLA